jgi:D-tyrosyl-tRNA(Tyr) deacylase
MRALLQRVSGASVTIGSEITGRIGQGLVVLLGVATDDAEKDADYLADKIANLRIFNDADNKFNLSATDVRAEMLVVSQFTLFADTKKGRRPSFTSAAPPDKAVPLYEYFVGKLKCYGFVVATGKFGAHMHISLSNDGPVTIYMDSRDKLLV